MNFTLNHLYIDTHKVCEHFDELHPFHFCTYFAHLMHEFVRTATMLLKRCLFLVLSQKRTFVQKKNAIMQLCFFQGKKTIH